MAVSFCDSFQIRIAALNDDISDDEDDDNFIIEKRTKEAQEAEAFALYNEALALQQQDEVEQARQLYLQLLQLPLIKQVEPSDSAGPLQPNLALRYSTHKNLANIASQEGNWETAIENYLQAVLVDSTDVTVWHKISKLALSLHQYSLARHAYEQGLECNAKHWPCLDGVITVLYVLNNYEACLYYVGRALRRDPGYVKGLVFLHQILTEQPSLLKSTASYFTDCDPVIYDVEVDEEEMTEFVEEALEMRRKKQELAKIPDPPTVSFTRPHIAFTWICLGESLISLYDHIAELVTRNKQVDPAQPRVNFACRVDLTSCVNMDPTAPVPECAPPPPTLPDTPTVAEPQPPTTSDVMTSDATLQDRLTDTGLTDMDLQDLEGSMGRGRGQKRKRLQWEEAGKRRSARVRNTSQKKDEEENVDYYELLSKILPLSLLQVCETEEATVVSDQPECPVDLSRASMAGDSQECFKDMDVEASKMSSESVSAREQESVEVHHFLETRQTNSGVLSLLRDFLFLLSKRSRVKWSEGLSDVYCRAYGRLRAHFEYSSLFCQDVPSDFKDMAQMCLVGCELKTDAWMVSRGKTVASPGRSPSTALVTSPAMCHFPGKFFPKDVCYLVGLTNFTVLVGEDNWKEFCARVFWLKARFHTLQNDMDLAIFYFDKVGHLLYPAMDALIFLCTSHVDLYVHQSVINSECTILTKLISKR
ncbi:hypothetical protein NP493_324g00033 [Ridgeia piscesae]|uniref:Uncharacterized protein n=1 Tax=Ridgeia piscesae TaxID=27915 RepID=A0AAD9NUA9_RIDPI|nr:hypothetical protein NP493_324g00033 [Ridgeia piscesae]